MCLQLVLISRNAIQRLLNVSIKGPLRTILLDIAASCRMLCNYLLRCIIMHLTFKFEKIVM